MASAAAKERVARVLFGFFGEVNASDADGAPPNGLSESSAGDENAYFRVYKIEKYTYQEGIFHGIPSIR